MIDPGATLRVLVLEDKRDQADRLRQVCLGVAELGDVLVEVSRNAEDAMWKLGSGHFDLAICDLSVPKDANSIAADKRHGIRVVRHALEAFPGMPIVVLSEFAEDKSVLREFRGRENRADPYGIGTDVAMFMPFPNDSAPECDDYIRECLGSSFRVAKVNVINSMAVDLSLAQWRVLQVFTVGRGADTVEIKNLLGGRSSSKTLQIELKRNGLVVGFLVAKIDTHDRIASEDQRAKQAAMFYPPGLPASVVDRVMAGAGDLGGLFYRTQDGQRSLFECLESDQDAAFAAVTAVMEGCKPLARSSGRTTQRLNEIRGDLIFTSELPPNVDPEKIAECDEIEIEIGLSIQHGDLHGENILVAGDEGPDAVLIDLADVRDCPSCFDPITLELSTVFHPEAQLIRGAWPSKEQMEDWSDLDAYVIGCPFEQHVRICRGWARDVASSEQEILAVALSYALRQLRFDSSPADLALALVEHALGALATT